MRNKTQAKIQQIFKDKGGVNKGCKYIEKRLNYEWTWKYIYHVYRGTVRPSPVLICKLNALEYPPKQRYRRKVEAFSKERLGRWMSLSVYECGKALDQAVKEKNG